MGNAHSLFQVVKGARNSFLLRRSMEFIAPRHYQSNNKFRLR
jgi:hypothetical protein